MPRTLAHRALCVVVLFVALIATFVTGIGGSGDAHAAGAVGPIADAEVGQIPYQVLILIETGDGIRQCGGSVVAPAAVITAAHCVSDVAPAAVAIAGGFTDIGKYQDEGAQVSLADSIKVHPLFDGSAPGDVAVVTVAEAFDVNESLQPIDLADAADLADSADGVVSGWGLTADEDGAAGRRLQTAEVNLVPTPVCALDHFDLSPEFEFCAENVAATDCGDSDGSPLVVRSGTQSLLAGLASYGADCAAPRVFTELPSFQGWVKFQAGLSDEAPEAIESGPDDSAEETATESSFVPATPEPEPAAAEETDEAQEEVAEAEAPQETEVAEGEEAEESSAAAVAEATPTPAPAASTEESSTEESSTEESLPAASTEESPSASSAADALDELPVTGPSAQLTLTQWALIVAITGILVLSSPQMYRARRTTRMIDLLEQVPLDERDGRSLVR